MFPKHGNIWINVYFQVNELSQIGGDHVLKATRRILVYLMADELAAKFFWLGRKGKRNFSKFTLASSIVGKLAA